MRERHPLWLGGPVAASLAGALATSAVMTLTGPFGTYDAMGPGVRALYWLAVVSVNWLLVDLTTRALVAKAGDRVGYPRVTIPLIAAALVLVPATAVVVLATRWAMPQADIAPADLLWKVGLLLVAVGLLFARITPRSYEGCDDTGAPAAAAPTQPIFHQRIPAHLTGPLLCLEQEDHYLRIHTADGSALIHCRMADAERELAGADGLRVHRSWWVAGAAVAGVERRGARPLLRLVDGRRVPVGKTYRPRLKQAGWL